MDMLEYVVLGSFVKIICECLVNGFNCCRTVEVKNEQLSAVCTFPEFEKESAFQMLK